MLSSTPNRWKIFASLLLGDFALTFPSELEDGSKVFIAKFALRRDSPLFFETRWALVHHLHSQASGNPVRIGDGCATVTGYKLPRPLVAQSGTGKAGVRFQARSQDTGLAVLVVVCNAIWLPSLNSERQGCVAPNFSVKEKDEASPCRECGMGFAECLHSLICRGLKVFVFRPRAGLSII